jgi:hypothetical protein
VNTKPSTAVDVADPAPTPEQEWFIEWRDFLYSEYRGLLTFIGVWVAAVMFAVFKINAPTDLKIWTMNGYKSVAGYTWSLFLIFLPLLFLGRWYLTRRDKKKLRLLMRALVVNVLVVGGAWIVLDVFLAKLLFTFPNHDATVLPMLLPGYSWDGDCSTLWTILRGSCYQRSIPTEEIIFYLGNAAVLSMMYMWATEDFYCKYTIPRAQYEEEAKKAPPLIKWNRTVILVAAAIFVAGFIAKKFGSWPHDASGWPSYLFIELIMVFLPLAALYTNVRTFTNPRAFMFVLVLQVLVSLMWEVTLAMPFGWWGYQYHQMSGLTVSAWSNLPIEACGLWLSVGWGSMFIYETTKIKVLSGRTWREVLWGPRVAASANTEHDERRAPAPA